MSVRSGTLILYSGLVLGGVAGWFISRLLLEHTDFAVLVIVVTPLAATVGLLLGYLVARWLSGVK